MNCHQIIGKLWFSSHVCTHKEKVRGTISLIGIFQIVYAHFTLGNVSLSIQKSQSSSAHCSWQFSSLFSHGFCGEAHLLMTTHPLVGSVNAPDVLLPLLPCPYKRARHRGPGKNNRVRACENYQFSSNWDTSWAHRREIWRCWEPWSSQPKGDSWGSQL